MTTRRSGHALVWLAHPTTTLAVAVLLLNDHLLKELWPGPVTGKLSDFAGLVAAPPLMALLIRCPAPVAIALTGTLFTLMKVTAAGAEVASWLWSLFIPSRIVADPTDLIALPALGLAWLVWRRAARRPPVRLPQAVLIVPVAMFAATATGAMPRPPSATAVEVQERDIVVRLHPLDTVASTDGGVTWRKTDGGVAWRKTDGGVAWRKWDASPPETVQSTACVPGDQAHCYRIVPGLLQVEESADGGNTWTTAWQISPGRQEWLDRVYRVPSEGTEVDHANSLALAVQAVPDDGGAHIVVVANGRDGVAVRDPSGRWQRLGLTPDGGLSAKSAPSLTDPGSRIDGEMWVAILVAVIVLLIGLALDGCVEEWPAGFPFAGLVLWVGLLGIALKPSLGLIGPLVLFGGMPLALVGGTAVLVMWGLFQCLRGPSGGTSILLALLTFGGVFLPFLGWSAGSPDSYGVAGLLAVILGAAPTASLIAKRALSDRLSQREQGRREKDEGPAGKAGPSEETERLT
ncbi:hypothetical protein [Microtetraspora sp. NBRC 16547]|uniref:hypothetical protein n=1 Tax=Microtetraspora sp. NBRC 16547 TaxID=3030993 RepID=UPI0024A108A8|nr:hypothetical protein [Microtetraspora sp. NBRC 16547]GLX02227.1 hypothetical protein Misp02_63130 [Microtetraspora sp. NBRC 16547]